MKFQLARNADVRRNTYFASALIIIIFASGDFRRPIVIHVEPREIRKIDNRVDRYQSFQTELKQRTGRSRCRNRLSASRFISISNIADQRRPRFDLFERETIIRRRIGFVSPMIRDLHNSRRDLISAFLPRPARATKISPVDTAAGFLAREISSFARLAPYIS